MTPLEAARILAANAPVCPHPNSGMWICATCSEETDDEQPDDDDYVPSKFNHDPDCPWLAMPQIVAALDAAEAMLEEWGHTKLCPFCAPRLQLRPAANHESVCPWMALVKAMKG